MSQETKQRTMIGTIAPVTHPRPQSTSAPYPTVAPPTSSGSYAAVAPPSPPPTVPPSHQAPTLTPTSMNSLPTVGMGPAAGPAARGPDGGGDSDMFIGQELCGYTIRRKLAEGGMGVVYEGEHRKIGRLGAIKVLKLELCRAEDVVERFYQEARAVNSIRHENIVDIYDFGRDSAGRVFFVMEYLEGEPLSSRIRRGALTWPEAFPILEQTLRALKAAHDKGFVHRDLKPDNIWLRYIDGRIQVKLLDFGIAKLVGTESPREKLTQTGSVIGTPHYMSPEQINGSRDIDHRTDLYALGVITYEMFAGVTPFVGETLQAIMTGHLFREPPRLADIPVNLGVPPMIAEIIDRMLVKDAGARYDSVAEVLADLYDVNRNQAPTHAETLSRVRPTRGPTLLQNPPAPAPRKSKRGVVIGMLAVAGLAGGGFAIWKSQQHEAPVVVVDTKSPGPGKITTETPPTPSKPVPPPIDATEARKTALALLHAALREAEPAVRTLGSDALGKIKDQPSIPALTALTEKDPDDEVRGHSGEALGMLGASSTVQLLAKLEAAAPPPLKVWYASALARLGDKSAAKRLHDYARNKDVAVSFKAVLTLGDISQPGDRKAIAALKATANRMAAVQQLPPDAAVLILTKMAALRDAGARKALYALLEQNDEAYRIAAAEGLALLGDEAGKAVLHDVFANASSPNQLVAAVAQIPLGDYGGLELITKALADSDPGRRRLAARALGDIGESNSLRALVTSSQDKDWTVRIAAAAAIISIVGLDPKVLAQASVDWTKGALASQDWAVRKAAAGVLADIPASQAVPLLAQAFSDTNRDVRIAASKSAGKIKSAEAATKVADAVKTETDPKVKEQQVLALGEIGKVGGAAAHDTLAQISEEPGRIGVLAAGSLIAVGDIAGNAKLELAIAARQPDLRLAAVEAASAANNEIVVPTLKIGLMDRVFNIQFIAAEGLATLQKEKAAAVPVLTKALDSKDPDVAVRAIAALTRLGEKVKDTARTPAEMIDSPDPKLRLAAVQIVRALPTSEGVPLLRRLIADADEAVRHAGVEAIEDVIPKDEELAIKLYKPLVHDEDMFVRSKAQGQLSRLAPPPPPPATKTADATPAATPPTTPPPDDKVKLAFDEATAASVEATAASTELGTIASQITTTLAAPPGDNTPLKTVAELPQQLEAATAKLEATATKLEAAASAVAAAATGSTAPDAAKLVTDAQALAKQARDAATTSRGQVADAAQKVAAYVTMWTKDPAMLINRADVEIANGKFAEAKRDLDEAAKLSRQLGQKRAAIDYSYAQLYDNRAKGTTDPAAKRKLMQQAVDAYGRFIKSGTGPLVETSRARVTELGEDQQGLVP